MVFGKPVAKESLKALSSGSRKIASQKIFLVTRDHVGVIFGCDQIISRHNTFKGT